MVRMRKGAVEREGFVERQWEDLLEDIASHVPLEPQQLRLGESIRLHRDIELRQTEGLQFDGSD
jgi:hypothetical protein